MIIKQTENKYPVLDLIKNRWSPVGFSEKNVEPEKIQSMFEAARWAPSCYNEQPWSFIFATKNSIVNYGKILDCLAEGNQSWASKTPMLVLGLTKKTFDQNGYVNDHAKYDLGQAVAHLSIQASSDGLYLHQMAGFDPVKAREIFDIPDNYDAVVAIAIGYLAEEKDIPENFLARDKGKRIRKDTSEFIFSDKFGFKSEIF